MQRNKKQDNGWYIDYISSAFIEASLSESTQSRGQNTNKQKEDPTIRTIPHRTGP